MLSLLGREREAMALPKEIVNRHGADPALLKMVADRLFDAAEEEPSPKRPTGVLT